MINDLDKLNREKWRLLAIVTNHMQNDWSTDSQIRSTSNAARFLLYTCSHYNNAIIQRRRRCSAARHMPIMQIHAIKNAPAWPHDTNVICSALVYMNGPVRCPSAKLHTATLKLSASPLCLSLSIRLEIVSIILYETHARVGVYRTINVHATVYL